MYSVMLYQFLDRAGNAHGCVGKLLVRVVAVGEKGYIMFQRYFNSLQFCFLESTISLEGQMGVILRYTQILHALKVSLFHTP